MIIDSLIGCSGGRAFDENKSDFATPLYWLSRNNGTTFHGATIMIIHHANKTGGFRGTSAIRDAVDETWHLQKPGKDQLDVPVNSRIITIEKSRSGRSGTSLIMQQEKDLSFSISDFTPEIDPGNTAPSSITDRVLHRIRTCYPRPVSSIDLNADQLVGGNAAAITKSLQRLAKRKLIEVVGKEGKAKLYQAVLARGEAADAVRFAETPSKTGVSEGGQPSPESASVQDVPQTGQVGTLDRGCPPPPASAGGPSQQIGQPDKYPRATSNLDDAYAFWEKEDAAGALAAAAKAAEDYQANKPVTLEAQVMTATEGLEAIASDNTIDVDAKEV